MKLNPGKATIGLTLALAAIGSLVPALMGEKSSVAKARPKPTECYKISHEGSPFADLDKHGHAPASSEVWCYKELEDQQGSRLVYNVDDKGKLRPELSMVVSADGTITHGSRNKGEVTVHRVRAGDFSPIGAPLNPPPHAERVAEPMTTADAESDIQMFWEYQEVAVHTAKVKEGVLTQSVPETAMPWRGYWFPYASGRMHNGQDSVLSKYDKFIARRAAMTNPGSQAWEKWWHSYHGLSWSGHCNGWAAASVLEPEPKRDIKDPFSGITFTVNDIKGLLTERHYCPKLVFFGSRAEGENQASSLRATTFHNVLTYFIGELKKPVLVDVHSTATIENNVISGYSMKISKAGSRSYYVEAALNIHYYDNNPVDATGPAPIRVRKYYYYLNTNENGEVIGGSWASSYPDFIWVALAPGNCKDNNQVVDQFWIDEIRRYEDPNTPLVGPSPAPSPSPRPATGAPAPAPSATPAVEPAPAPSPLP